MLVLWAGAVQADVPGPARIAETYGKLPLTFEANVGQAGQVDPAVRFLSRGQGYTLFLTPAEAVLHLSGPGQESAVVRLRPAGGKRAPRIVGLEPQVTKSNYLLGNDRGRWHTGVSHYARVRYEEVYPGIDLIYHGNQRQLEYDFVVAPGADPKRIRLDVQGAGRITIGEKGELVLHTAQGDLVQRPPVVYQETGGERRVIAGRYVLLASHRVGFALGRYDRNRPLVIDPVLVYATFLGGGFEDQIRDVAVDSAGNVYVTGMTNSTNFYGAGTGSLQPNLSGFLDAFVTKINAAGTAIVYSTYLGGSGLEWGFGIAVDEAGNAYVTGWTDSTDFPGVDGSSIQPAKAGSSDAFATKIDPTGAAIVYSTYVGGRQTDYAHSIAVDSAGNAYVTGVTNSVAFLGIEDGSIQPTNGGSDDTFVTKINPAGTAVVYTTFLGGSSADWSWDIAADSQGNAYVTGETFSLTFPGVNAGSIQAGNAGYGDGFVTKINATGTAIVYSTFLGGAFDDMGRGIAVDSAGNAYVAGLTTSYNFRGISADSIQSVYGGGPFPGDGFVTKINPAGTAVVYSTYLGGSAGDECVSIAVDSTGTAYVTGGAGSAAFPGLGTGSIQPNYSGGLEDAFVTRINPAGTAILGSTLLGGADWEAGIGIGLDGAGDIYVAGITLSTTFTGVSSNSLQPGSAGDYDGFIAKIGEVSLSFFTVEPCRLIDTRNPDSLFGGPALQPGASRLFVVTGACGIPLAARALSVNLTVPQPATAGYLLLQPGGQPNLPISTVNFSPGQTRANNAILPLAFDLSGSLQALNGSAGSVHLILDVNGYFAVP
jgi:hypothetical protein